MRLDVDFPDVSDARFRRDVGVGRVNAAVALLAGITVFIFTLRYRGNPSVVFFAGSYMVIPLCLATGMLLDRSFRLGKLFQASIIIMLVKFVITVVIHLTRMRILSKLGA